MSDVVAQAIIAAVLAVVLALIALWKEARDAARAAKLKADVTTAVVTHTEAVAAKVDELAAVVQAAPVRDRPGGGTHSVVVP